MIDSLFGRRIHHDRSQRRFWGFAMVVPLLMFAAQLDACTGPSVNEGAETGSQENTVQSATVDEILGDSDAYYGAQVTVTGKVTEEITPLTFELNGQVNEDSTRYGESADGLLVVENLESTSDPEVEVGQIVEVRGTVREFNVQGIEDQIGRSLADGVFTYWAGQTSLVAASVEPTGATAS